MKPVNELKLDYDQTNPQKTLSADRLKFVAKLLRLEIKDIKAYRTANGIHIRIVLRSPVHPLIAVTIQSLMGSDYARETYNLIRVLNLTAKPEQYSQTAHETWNVLYYKKLVNKKVSSQEVFDPDLTEKLRRELNVRDQTLPK